MPLLMSLETMGHLSIIIDTGRRRISVMGQAWDSLEHCETGHPVLDIVPNAEDFPEEGQGMLVSSAYVACGSGRLPLGRWICIW